MPRYNEFHSCVALATWWTFYARIHKLYEGLLFHVPNQSATSVKYRVNNKKMGVRSGTPDYMLAIPRGGFHGLFIEMKAPDGSVSPEQRLAASALQQQGYRVETFYSTDAARQCIEQYLKC